MVAQTLQLPASRDASSYRSACRSFLPLLQERNETQHAWVVVSPRFEFDQNFLSAAQLLFDDADPRISFLIGHIFKARLAASAIAGSLIAAIVSFSA